MNRIYLSLGSNVPQRDSNTLDCIHWLAENFKVTAQSDIYSTPAINGKDNDYTNAVVGIESEKDFDELHEMFKKHERDCGRTPQSKQNGLVPIDIDIVIWNDNILRDSDYKNEYFQIGMRQIRKEK